MSREAPFDLVVDGVDHDDRLFGGTATPLSKVLDIRMEATARLISAVSSMTMARCPHHADGGLAG